MMTFSRVCSGTNNDMCRSRKSKTIKSKRKKWFFFNFVPKN